MKYPFLITSLTLLCLCIANVASAQATYTWSKPERVWGYENLAETPFLVSDQNETVHAFNSRDVDRGILDITYRQWTVDSGWSEPIDIMLSPEKDIARVRGVAIDGDSTLHMVFYGGDDQQASIYYSSAPASLANTARGWSSPILIGSGAGPVSDAAMINDGGDQLFVVYSGSEIGMGVYSTFSLDGGKNWSEPDFVFQSAEGNFPTHYSLALDDAGALHVVWAEADLLGNGQKIYYSRLDSEQTSWTTPVVLESRTGEEYETDWPALVYHDGELILIYQDSLPASKFMRRSDDSGLNWSDTLRVFSGFIGENGSVSFAKDSAGELHALVANRTDTNMIHGLWHTTWQGSGWAKLNPVVSGPRVISPIGGDGFDPSRPHATVVQGKLLLTTWVTDPGAGLNGVFYSFADLGTPKLPLVLPPKVVPTPMPDSISPTIVTETPPPTPSPLVNMAPDVRSRSQSSRILFLGALPVLGLIGIVTLFQIRRNK